MNHEPSFALIDYATDRVADLKQEVHKREVKIDELRICLKVALQEIDEERQSLVLAQTELDWLKYESAK